jgi:hypothetical protein
MSTATTNKKIRPNVVDDTIKWLEGIENEERRKLVNALKRTESVTDNASNPKLILAKRNIGDQNLEPIIIKGQRHGKPRFSLEYVSQTQLTKLNEYLHLEEALAVVQRVKVERSNYAHRIKLAFMFLAGKHGIKGYSNFRYSTDGEHFTKAYKSQSDTPQGEETISHEQALAVLKEDAKIHPSAYENPAFGVAQTKVFRVSSPQHKPIYNEELNYSYLPHNDGKSSWITISKSLETNGKPNSVEKKAYYTCKKIFANELQLRNNKSNKLVWPANQSKSLIYLIDLCKELILNQCAKQLGEGPNYYAIVYEKPTTSKEGSESGTEGFLYKALVAPGKDKTEASNKACEAISQVWTKDTGSNETNTAKAITCLSLSDCSLLKYLIESEINNK